MHSAPAPETAPGLGRNAMSTEMELTASAVRARVESAASGGWSSDVGAAAFSAVSGSVDWGELGERLLPDLADAIRRFLGEKHGPLPVPHPPPSAAERFLFSAENDTDGRELWVSDGTRAGTFLVKDINPGPGDAFPFSFPGSFGALGDGRALFGASDGVGGVELWITDGTAAGTRLVEDLLPTGTIGSDPRSFVPLGDGRALFAADAPDFGRSLWVSDGSAEGTRLVSPATNGRSSLKTDIGVLRPGVALVESFDAGYRVLLTDGTEAGTSTVKEFGFADAPPFGFSPIGDGRLLFRAEEAGGGAGAELWISDGTEAGTRLVKDINPGEGDSFPGGFRAFGDGLVLFSAFGGFDRSGAWITDGTETGTRFLKDVFPSLSSPGSFADLGDGRALFIGRERDDARGSEIWITDGTEAGTRLVKDINPGRGDGAFDSVPLGGGPALVPAFDGALGIEPWITDGTEAGTVLVRDMRPGAASSDAFGFAPFGDGRALFAANDGVRGREVWITDGTEAGTRLVEDIRPGSEGSAPGQFVLLENGGATDLDPFG
jgi:ELWxxDGT repeat protein